MEVIISEPGPHGGVHSQTNNDALSGMNIPNKHDECTLNLGWLIIFIVTCHYFQNKECYDTVCDHYIYDLIICILETAWGLD